MGGGELGDAYLRSWEEPPSLKPNVTEMSRLRWKTNHLEGDGEKEVEVVPDRNNNAGNNRTAHKSR